MYMRHIHLPITNGRRLETHVLVLSNATEKDFPGSVAVLSQGWSTVCFNFLSGGWMMYTASAPTKEGSGGASSSARSHGTHNGTVDLSPADGVVCVHPPLGMSFHVECVCIQAILVDGVVYTARATEDAH